MLKRVWLDQTIEMFFSLTGEFGGTTGAWTIHQARRALVRKAMDPRAQGGIGKLERVGDGLQALPFHDVAHWTWPHDRGHMWEVMSPHLSR